MAKILLVEDSEFDFNLVDTGIGKSHELVWTKSMVEARETLKSSKFDLIILDMKLPDGDGIELCSEIRADSSTAETPIIILSGEAETNRKVLGFQLGADDYLVKPVCRLELRARVDRKLNSREEIKERSQKRQLGPLKMDLERMSAETDANLDLTPVEFKLLWKLSKRDGIIYSRPQLTEAVYGTNYSVSPRTIDSHIRSLRKKLGPYADSIKTVQGAGYQFRAAKLTQLDQSA